MSQSLGRSTDQIARPKLLLMAYECSPFDGSELAVGWNRLIQAAREFEPHIIVSDRSFKALKLARYTGLLPAHVSFYTPEPDRLLPLLQKLPVIFVYNYAAYQHWQRLAYRLAQSLHREHHFALVHHINGTGFREPGYTWKMDIPYIWGPTGGTQNFPSKFLSTLTFNQAMKERLRTAVNHISLRFKPRVHQAAARAAVIFAANSTNQRDLERAFHRPVELLLETGIDTIRPTPANKYDDPTVPLRILWIGELATRKSLPLLLHALARLKQTIPFELQVIGRGPLEKQWKQLARDLGIWNRCTFAGHVTLAASIEQQQWAHVFVFTSLRDTSGNVMLEALSAGVPVVCFDLQGAHDIITPDCGIRLPVVDPDTGAADLARTLIDLAQHRDQLRRLSAGACLRARDFLWTANGDRMNALYHRLAGTTPAREPEPAVDWQRV
jgi:glycosyltransferase involved in cell wall biosynthesis